jgi:hypothetical protein
LKKSFFPISFILLALCFSPALCLPFAHHDNVRFFGKFYSPPSHDDQKRDPQYAMAYLLGRPLTAEIHQFLYTRIFKIEDLRVVRWIIVAVFAVCSGLLANILYSFGINPLESLCISVAIFILPGIQDAIIMIALQNALAVWLVLWAYLISARQGRNQEFFDDLVIFCLILASMLLYPQWSFFLFVPVLARYLTAPAQNLQSMHKTILRTACLFGITAVFYYFFVKTFLSVHNARAGSYAFTIDLNLLYWKFLLVFTSILPMAFNFWNFHTVTWLGLMLMAMTLVLLRKRALLCSLLLFSTTGFWLLVRTDIILHRIFFVTSVMALTAFLIGTRNKYIIIGAMTIGLLGVHYLTLENALNYYLEFSFIKQRLMEGHEPLSRIHIVLAPANGKGYNGQATVDDTFNSRTASFNFNTDTVNLVKAALKDMGMPDSRWVYSCEDDARKCVGQMPLGYHLLITHSNKNQPVYNSPGMVLIDMNDL